MKIHEYQAQAMLREFGVPAPEGILASTPAEAAAAAKKIGGACVLKAQVHSGGRGKAGGIRRTANPAEAEAAARAILALRIQNLPVRKVYVVPAASFVREVYLSLLLDRASSRLTFLGCAAGGVEIEETARKSPGSIIRLPVPADPAGLSPEMLAPLANALFPSPALAAEASRLMMNLARLYRARDCSLIELNPLVETAAGGLLALDAKILLDDSALYRQPANVLLRDPDSEDPAEAEARAAGLSFVGLDGDIGCLVNGAGLAMATMDTIKHFGGAPANFLDVGGSSSPEKTATALRLIRRNPRLKAILINIFGGITRCDDVARGLLAAFAEERPPVPIVIRLTGTNEDAGRALLSGQNLTVARTLEEGAETAVALARIS